MSGCLAGMRVGISHFSGRQIYEAGSAEGTQYPVQDVIRIKGQASRARSKECDLAGKDTRVRVEVNYVIPNLSLNSCLFVF